MKRNSKVEQKYYNYLTDLKRKIDSKVPFSASEFAAKRKISTAIINYLIKFKYVEKTGYVYHKGYTYNWIGPTPDIKMVNKIRKYHSTLCNSYSKKAKKAKEAKVVVNTLKPKKSVRDITVKGATEIKVVNPKVIYTKVLFGLFTLKSTIQY